MAGNHNHATATIAGYDPSSGNDNIRLQVDSTTVTTDATTGITYGELKTTSGGGPATIADGADATLGAKADASASSDGASASLISLFKRLLGKIPGFGSNTSDKCWPVVIASDQSTIAIQRHTSAVYTTAQSAVSSGNSGDLSVGGYTEISIDITTTAQSGTNPTLQFFYDRKGFDGNYYALWQSEVLTAAANTISTSIGAGMAYPQSLALTGRLRWVVGGTNSPSYTFTPNIYGR
ncbi:MAG TPA: hypothetical protein VH593_17340 [Ktedonobacteraceae bacterium]|jgi:hypothetical protein